MSFRSDNAGQQPDWWRTGDIGERLRYTVDEPEYETWWQDIREYAELAAEEPLPALTFEAFREFADTGGREQYERIYFERRGRIGALALMVLLGMSGRDTDHSRQRLDKESPNVGCIDRDLVIKERSDTTYKVDITGTVAESVAESAAVYVRALEEALWNLCGEYTWCLPAHLPEVSAYPVWEEIDLFAAETAGMLAELAMLLDGKVDNRIIQRMRDEVQRRVLEPAGDLSRTFGWETAHHNWSAVCAAGCGMAALLLLEDREQKTAVIERMKRAAQHFLAGYGEDGGCAEGLGYWVYGFGYYTYWMDMLSAGDLDGKYWLDDPKIAAIAVFPEHVHLSEGRFVNFSDSGEQEMLPPGLLSCLAEVTGRSYSLPFVLPVLRQDPCRRWGHLLRNILWSEPRYFRSSQGENVNWEDGFVDAAGTSSVKGTHNASASPEEQASGQRGGLFNYYWSDLCWLVSRAEQEIQQQQPIKQGSEADHPSVLKEAKSSAGKHHFQTDDNSSCFPEVVHFPMDHAFTAAFAAKGGHNDEPHNHNDLGSFILHASGENILCDLGAGMYTQAYFATGREHILNISSAGHSVPQINGYEQRSGPEAAAIVQHIHTAGHEVHFVLDLTDAYPNEAGLVAMHRNFHWHRSEAEMKLHLQDSFQFAQTAYAEANKTPHEAAKGKLHPSRADQRNDNCVIERLISHLQPDVHAEEVIWTGKRAQIRLQIPKEQYHVEVERIPHHDHDGQPIVLYRTLLGFRSKVMDDLPEQRLECSLEFTISPLV
ncbi:heparinase II/III domain-containing protein [Paenibacillus sp. Z6-24]